MKKLLAMLMAVAMLLSMTTGLAEQVKPESPIVVGVTCPYSGFVANLGENLVRGIQLALAVEGRTDDIKLIIEDTELTSELAVTKCESLLKKDKATFIIGSVTGFEGDAQAAWLKDNPDVIFMPGYSATEDMTMRDFSPNMIRAGWTANQVMFDWGAYVAKELGYKKIVSVGADYSYPWGQAAGFAMGFMSNGGEKIEYIWYPEGNTDFNSIMATLLGMANDYDAVFLNDGGATVVAFWKAWEQYGLNNVYPQLIGGTNVGDTNVLTEVSDGYVGVMSAGFYADGDPSEANQTFRAKYIEMFNAEPDAVSVQGYDTMRCIIKGLDACGWKIDDQQALIDAILALEITDSPRGSFYFDEYHNAVQNVYIKETQMGEDGKMVSNIVKTFENVNQFGPYSEMSEAYMAMPRNARDYPLTERDAFMKDIAQYFGQEYVDKLIENGGW